MPAPIPRSIARNRSPTSRGPSTAGRPAILAEEAKRIGAVLIHYSTDYVFDGKRTTPYPEDAPTAPQNVYGSSKLEGERAIAAAGGARDRFSHELGVRLARQEFPADDPQARRGARRAHDRCRSDRRSQLEPGARRGDGAHRRRGSACARRAVGAVPPLVHRAGELVRLRARDRRRCRETADRADHDRRISDAGAPSGVRRSCDVALRVDVRFCASRIGGRRLADCVASPVEPSRA